MALMYNFEALVVKLNITTTYLTSVLNVGTESYMMPKYVNSCTRDSLLSVTLTSGSVSLVTYIENVAAICTYNM